MLTKVGVLFSAGIMAITLAAGTAGAAEPALKPYILGASGPGAIEAKFDEVKAAVSQQGFEVVGDYAPYKGARVLVVTNEALKTNAAKSEFGAYGAAMRVALTDTGKELQVSYTNPLYYARAYRMKDTLAETAAALEKALGKKGEFGSKEGLTPDKLRKYHYMVMMPYFTDPVKLASHPSHEAALKAVEDNLAAKKGGASRVYRIDLPGKKESVFGVGLTEGDASDAVIMKVVDMGEMKHTAHLPYELIVSDGTVYMLHGKFRIALDFPDLTMGTFMKISGAPGAIEDALKLVAAGK
jgi:hypothetical protein